MKNTAKILLAIAATLLAAYILIFSAANGCSTVSTAVDGGSLGDILVSARNDFFGLGEEEYKEIIIAMPEHNDYTAIEDKLCYQTLVSDSQREAYAAIEQAIFRVTDIDCGELGVNRTVAVPISGLSSMEIFMVKEAVLADHPEVFWLNGYYSIESNMHDGNYIFLYSDYTFSDIQLLSRELEQSVASYLREIPRSLSEYERELLIHDLIIEGTVYDSETADLLMTGNGDFFADSTCVGVLVDGEAICGGYANAFKLLCNRVGLSCGLVLGTSKNAGHMWNVVRVDGKWYYVDTTWDDPLNSDDTDSISYIYFNITTDELLYDHVISPRHPALTGGKDTESHGNLYNFYTPECTDDSLSYFALNAIVIEELNSSGYMKIKNAMLEVGTNERVYVIMPDDIDAKTAENWLTQTVGGAYGSIKYSLSQNCVPMLGSFSILSPPQCDNLYFVYLHEQ